MCRNIKLLHHFEPPATRDEIEASALQYVRKLSGMQAPSKANEAAFNQAVKQITEITAKLFAKLETNGPARSREEERQKAVVRGKKREEQIRKRILEGVR